MATLVEVNHDPVVLQFDHAPSLIQLFRRRLVKAAQLLPQPTITSVGQDRRHRVQVYVQPDFAGQAVQVKEVDGRAQTVLDAIATRIADDQLACQFLEVVGQEQSRLFPSQAIDGQLAERAAQSVSRTVSSMERMFW